MIDDFEDWQPPAIAHRLIGGPCDGQVMTIDRRMTVVQACEPPPKRFTHDMRLTLHQYERQTFISRGQEYTFWLWSCMTEEERLAAVEKRL